jgi:hypothetical protein
LSLRFACASFLLKGGNTGQFGHDRALASVLKQVARLRIIWRLNGFLPARKNVSRKRSLAQKVP